MKGEHCERKTNNNRKLTRRVLFEEKKVIVVKVFTEMLEFCHGKTINKIKLQEECQGGRKTRTKMAQGAISSLARYKKAKKMPLHLLNEACGRNKSIRHVTPEE